MIKKIAAYGMVALMAAIFALDILTVVLSNRYNENYTMTVASQAFGENGDRIHFLNTGNSDAMLLESNGHFALIDGGNGSNNPRGKEYGKGYEAQIIGYLNQVAKGEDGKVHLDFILGTHNHYDHVGGFELIVSDPSIVVEKAYFKVYDKTIAKKYEASHWGLDEIYNRNMQALRAKQVPVLSDIPSQPFAFGDFTVQFFNTDTASLKKNVGENDASVGVKVTKGSTAAFLAADITNHDGLEQRLAKEVGRVDLLKLGHHGYYGATTSGYLRILKPKIAIATNWVGKVYPNVKWNLTMVSQTALYGTADNDGIIASFEDNGELKLFHHIYRS